MFLYILKDLILGVLKISWADLWKILEIKVITSYYNEGSGDNWVSFPNENSMHPFQIG